jgi:hypothetical protein
MAFACLVKFEKLGRAISLTQWLPSRTMNFPEALWPCSQEIKKKSGFTCCLAWAAEIYGANEE